MADKSQPSNPLIARLAILKAKIEAIKAAPASQFVHVGGNDDPEQKRSEILARTQGFIDEINAELHPAK